MTERRDFRQYRVKGRPTKVLDQGRVLVAVDGLEELRALGLDSLEGAMRFESGEVARDAGPRRTWRVEAPSGVLFVKVYQDVPWHWRLPFTYGNVSPARLEWDNIGALRRAGFDMPEPVAVGEAPSLVGSPRQSFLVVREVRGEPLDRLLQRGWPDPRGIGSAQARNAVIRDLSGMVRRLHACGFFHRDLYCGHLIVAPDPRWGRPFLIDLQRVGQNFPPRQRWLVKDLAALESSAPKTVSRSDRLRFLLSYLGKSHLDPEVRRWVRLILDKADQIRSHVPRYG